MKEGVGPSLLLAEDHYFQHSEKPSMLGSIPGIYHHNAKEHILIQTAPNQDGRLFFCFPVKYPLFFSHFQAAKAVIISIKLVHH